MARCARLLLFVIEKIPPAMMKNTLCLALLATLLFGLGCDYFPPFPEQDLNGSFTVSNLTIADYANDTAITETLTPCQKTTLVQFNATSHTYRLTLADSTCPLLSPFKDSGRWQIITENAQNFLLDTVTDQLEANSSTEFTLIFPGTYNGRKVSYFEVLDHQ
jgi:hypothetical protein